MMIAFPYNALTILLAEQKVPYTQIALISSCVLGFTYKILFAPFLDSYFIYRVGKRKTYILPIHIIHSSVLYTS